MLRHFSVGLVTGIFSGGVSAGLGAAFGATGAAILSSAGHVGYAAAEGAAMGAVGGAVLGGGCGFVSGSLRSAGFFSSQRSTGWWDAVLSQVAGSILGGLVGFGILQCAMGHLTMSIGATAAAFAVGAAVLGPAVAALIALVAVIAVGIGFCSYASCACSVTSRRASF